MARKGRIKSDTGIYHVVLRGQNNLFLNDKDYSEFIDILKRYFINSDSDIYAYSLEKNKAHLVFYTPGDISTVMKPFLTSYARYFNRTYNKNGKLFYDRYMSEPIEDSDMLKNAVIFVNERNKAIHTSKEEYSDKAELCAVTKFDKKSLEEIKNPSVIYPFADDYASMTDKELKDYILSIGAKDADKQDILERAVIHSNLSKARVSKVLNITKVSRPRTVQKPKKEETIKPKKQELSVWLLWYKKGVGKMFEKLPLKQMLKIFKSHAMATACIFFLGMFLASLVFGTEVGKYLFAVLSLLIYAVVLYSDAYDIAKRDKKSYTKEEPYFYKGFLLPVLLSIVTVVLYIIYFLVWKYMAVDGVLNIPGVLLNMIFIIWSFAFNGIIGLGNGYMNWYGYIIVIAVPIIISGIGYIAGLKDFDLHSKISKFIYENKEEKKDNGQKK